MIVFFSSPKQPFKIYTDIYLYNVTPLIPSLNFLFPTAKNSKNRLVFMNSPSSLLEGFRIKIGKTL